MRQSHPHSSAPSAPPSHCPPCPRPAAHHHFSRCHLGCIQRDGTMTWGLRRGGGGGGGSPPSSTSSASTHTHARDASLPLSPGRGLISSPGFQLPQQQLQQGRKAARGAASEAAAISASSHVAGSKVSLRRALSQVDTEVHRSAHTQKEHISWHSFVRSADVSPFFYIWKGLKVAFEWLSVNSVRW